MKKIKGVLFDMDGVIVDNHRYHFAAWMEFSQKYKFHLNQEIYRDQYNGKTNADLFKMIFGELSDLKINEYACEKEQLYQSLYRANIKAHTGLIGFLDYLQSKHIKIALGTSAPTQNVDFTLDSLKIRDYFPVIVDGSQVERGKPDPQVYQMCASKLGLSPGDCLVFEDALLGLEAAIRAGCMTVGVATSHSAIELETKTAKVILDFTQAQRLIETGF